MRTITKKSIYKLDDIGFIGIQKSNQSKQQRQLESDLLISSMERYRNKIKKMQNSKNNNNFARQPNV